MCQQTWRTNCASAAISKCVTCRSSSKTSLTATRAVTTITSCPCRSAWSDPCRIPGQSRQPVASKRRSPASLDRRWRRRLTRYNGSGFDPEGIAETEADHFGTAQSGWDAPSRRARPPAITSAGLTSICATDQVLAHVQEADIEISEGLVPPAGTVRFNAKGVSRSVACRSVALPAVRSGELRGSALVALPAVRSVELRPSTLVADRLSHPPQAVPSLREPFPRGTAIG